MATKRGILHFKILGSLLTTNKIGKPPNDPWVFQNCLKDSKSLKLCGWFWNFGVARFGNNVFTGTSTHAAYRICFLEQIGLCLRKEWVAQKTHHITTADIRFLLFFIATLRRYIAFLDKHAQKCGDTLSLWYLALIETGSGMAEHYPVVIQCRYWEPPLKIAR